MSGSPEPAHDAYTAAFSWIDEATSRYGLQCGRIIDLGVADAFTMPPQLLVAALQRAGASLGDHAYGFYGQATFNDAALSYVRQLFAIDAARELAVVNTAGAKGGLNLVAQTFVQKGDLVLTTTPGYPIFDLHALRLGADVYAIPLTSRCGFLPDLAAIDAAVLNRAKLLVVNYPNNPTGATLDREGMRKLIEVCRQHDILLVNDAAYAAITFDREARTSLFQHSGTQDWCIEIHTLSKSFQIPGWRAGFVLSGTGLAERLRAAAGKLDCGQPIFVQNSVAAAMQKPEYVAHLCLIVRTRLLGLQSVLLKHGFDASLPRGTFFLFCRAPRGSTQGESFKSAHECARFLVERYGIISIPWVAGGEHYLRFSVAFRTEQGDAELLADLDQRLTDAGLTFA